MTNERPTVEQHVEELRAELRGCFMSRTERARVEAELRTAIAERDAAWAAQEAAWAAWETAP